MSAYLKLFNEKLEQELKKKNAINDVLDKIEGASKIKKLYIVQGFIGLFSVYMILGHFAELVCNLFGFIYPAYASIKALESPGADDDKKWLTYWVVYALFGVVEFFSDIIFSWFPFYWLLKVIFLVYCFFPVTNNGSMLIYERVIRPVFIRNESKIDAHLRDLKAKGSEALQNAMSKSD